MSTPRSSSPYSSVPQKVLTILTEKIGILDVDSVRYSEPKIIKVPVHIRKDHDDAYEPRLLFIGPYHRRPSPMEEVKLLYLKDLLSRDVQHNMLSYYIAEIFKHVERARMEYSDPINLSNEQFVEMLVLDGCFIIEFLLKHAEGEKSENDPALLSHVRTIPTLRRDLLLLENQIPFFILEKILQLSNYKIPNFPKGTTTTPGKTLIDFALRYLTHLTHKESLTKDKLMEGYRKEENIYHLLHLSYLCQMVRLYPQETTTCIRNFNVYISRWVSSIKYCVHFSLIFFIYCIVHVLVLLFLWRKPSWSVSRERNNKTACKIPTATEMVEAGVTFEKKNSNCYLDVSFDKGYFKIPLLSIQEDTNSAFRNFLAFEQFCLKEDNTFTSYVVLMDNLIVTSSDVAVLKRRGVLEANLRSDEDVARLFNQMRSGLCFDNHNQMKTRRDSWAWLSSMSHDVNKYCDRDHNKWRAKLMHDYYKLWHNYFDNQLAFLSIAGAVLFLALTVVQTAYTVRSFYE